MDISKKIVAFDTDALIHFKKNSDNLEKFYPEKDYNRCVQDTIHDEYCFLDPKKDIESAKKEWAEFYGKHHIFIQPSLYELLFCEVGGDSSEVIRDKLCNEKLRCQVVLYLKGEHPEQFNKEKKYNKLKQEREAGKEKDWNAIPYGTHKEGSFPIDREDIYSSLIESLKKNEIPPILLPSYLRNGKNIKIQPTNHEIFIFLDDKEVIRKRYLNIEEEYPLLHSLLIFEIFSSRWKKHKRFKNRFSISLNKKVISIEKNVLPDCRIALSALPYVDHFVTMDKALAKLIRQLYPKYAKIKCLSE